MAFYPSRHLKKHQKIHAKEKPFECIKCHKAFYQFGDLTIHIRIHKSPECNKVLFRTNNLTIHKIKHTGQSPTNVHSATLHTPDLVTCMNIIEDIQMKSPISVPSVTRQYLII